MQGDVLSLPDSVTLWEEVQCSYEEFPVNNGFSDGAVKNLFTVGDNFKLNQDATEKIPE